MKFEIDKNDLSHFPKIQHPNKIYTYIYKFYCKMKNVFLCHSNNVFQMTCNRQTSIVISIWIESNFSNQQHFERAMVNVARNAEQKRNAGMNKINSSHAFASHFFPSSILGKILTILWTRRQAYGKRVLFCRADNNLAKCSHKEL